MIKHFSRNAHGRDLIVGDIHGTFTKLQAVLDAVGFDPARDRLFSVGDLVDRGPESEMVLEWLAKPWFHAVCGNHDLMTIAAAERNIDRRMYVANGGGWFLGLSVERQEQIATGLRKLPVAIELETRAGLIGIVHADCPTASWAQLGDALAGDNGAAFMDACTWSRDRIERGFGRPVAGVAAVVVGHTPVERWTSLENVIYIDTGGWRRGIFTLLDAGTLRPARAAWRGLDWS